MSLKPSNLFTVDNNRLEPITQSKFVSNVSQIRQSIHKQQVSSLIPSRKRFAKIPVYGPVIDLIESDNDNNAQYNDEDDIQIIETYIPKKNKPYIKTNRVVFKQPKRKKRKCNQIALTNTNSNNSTSSKVDSIYNQKSDAFRSDNIISETITKMGKSYQIHYHISVYCHICNQHVSEHSVEHLQQHYNNNPTKTWLKCDLGCIDNSFANNCLFIGHIAKHTGIAPFKCDYPNCGSWHASREDMKYHWQHIHFTTKYTQNKNKPQNIHKINKSNKIYIEQYSSNIKYKPQQTVQSQCAAVHVNNKQLNKLTLNPSLPLGVQIDSGRLSYDVNGLKYIDQTHIINISFNNIQNGCFQQLPHSFTVMMRFVLENNTIINGKRTADIQIFKHNRPSNAYNSTTNIDIEKQKIMNRTVKQIKTFFEQATLSAKKKGFNLCLFEINTYESNPYKCIQCKNTYSTRSKLIEHVKIHSGNITQRTDKTVSNSDLKKKRVNSPLIITSLNHSQNLKKNRFNSNLKNNALHNTYKCFECGNLLNKISSKTKAHICDECVLSYYSSDAKKNIQKNKQKIIIKTKSKFECPLCKQTFHLKSNLHKHLQSCNLNILPY